MVGPTNWKALNRRLVVGQSPKGVPPMTLLDPPCVPSTTSLHPILQGCASGVLPPNIAIMQLAMQATTREEVEALLAQARDALGDDPRAQDTRARLEVALRLWEQNPQAFDLVKSATGGVDHEAVASDPAHWAQVFDRMAAASPEGGVALYALGNPDLLRAATAEVVDRMRGWGLLGPGVRVVEIGCGIGRLVEALAGEVAQVTGLDVSEGMVARARERCAGLANVTLLVSSGRDLSGIGDGTAELVLGADVFPYLVQAGVAGPHVAEAARVLRPDGHLLILNYAYGGDEKTDRAEVAGLAARHGFEVLRWGTRDLSLWDASAFLLRKV
jgi:SAM-dependent methyltransferase